MIHQRISYNRKSLTPLFLSTVHYCRSLLAETIDLRAMSIPRCVLSSSQSVSEATTGAEIDLAGWLKPVTARGRSNNQDINSAWTHWSSSWNQWSGGEYSNADDETFGITSYGIVRKWSRNGREPRLARWQSISLKMRSTYTDTGGSRSWFGNFSPNALHSAHSWVQPNCSY